MRPVTERLVAAIMLDLFPSGAACVDFGLDGPDASAKLGALQYGLRHEVFTEDELDAALGNGPALTALVRRFGSALTFRTAWDDLSEAGLGDEDEDGFDEADELAQPVA